MHPDLRRLLILVSALAPLTPGMAQAAMGVAGASATVLPMASEQPAIVVDVRAAGNSGQLIVSASSAGARSDGASVSASVSANAANASAASATELALAPNAPTGNAGATGSGMLGNRVAAIVNAADVGPGSQLSVTLNYN